MSKKIYEEIAVGDFAEMTMTIEEKNIIDFAEVSGDKNPAHLDEDYAGTTVFKHRIAHGMYVASFISNLLGNELPGHGTVYLKQSLTFLAPVYIKDNITTRIEVVEKIDDKKRIIFKTVCRNQEGTVVIDGKATVSPPR